MSPSKVLVTFGCSWTYGVGLTYQPGMTIDEYQASSAWDPDICNRLSWRGLLSARHGLTNINFAQGGSSNQKQFRLAKEFFASDQFFQLKQTAPITVLWGITSTARNEMFDCQTGRLENFFYSSQTGLAKMMTMFSYNHDNEVRALALEMQHWSSYFDALGVDYHWFDTFNHHDYSAQVPGLIGVDSAPRDQMSYLVQVNGGSSNDNEYHTSDWKLDSPRVEFLVSKGILNPYSYHPTQRGHEQLCDFFKNLL